MIDVLLKIEAGVFAIEVTPDGLVTLTRGIQTAIALSLAGGNYADRNVPATDSDQWWGNFVLPELSRLRGETLSMLSREAVHSGNVSRLVQAAERDLAWMLDAGYVTKIEVSATIPAPRRVDLKIVTPEGSVRVTLPFGG